MKLFVLCICMIHLNNVYPLVYSGLASLNHKLNKEDVRHILFSYLLFSSHSLNHHN